MKKKNIVIIIILLLIVVVGSIGIYYFTREDNTGSSTSNEKLESSIYNVGYKDNMINNQVIIANRSELEDYLKNFSDTTEILDKYDESYFKNKSLALIYEVTGNSATSIKVENVEIIDDELKIEYTTSFEGEVGLTVMSGYLIVVEVDSSVRGFVK